MSEVSGNIGVIAVGSGVGEYSQSNVELARQVKNFDEARAGRSLDEWIRGRFGIIKRAKTRKLPSDLAVEAVKSALENTDISIGDIDFLVLNTATGDQKQPTTATEVQAKSGMRKDTFAFEINMPCAGVIYGLTIAKSLIESGMGRYGLVVGVDKMTDLVDPDDFIMSGMFGDGAGACIVGSGAEFEVIDMKLGSSADYEKALCIPAGGSALPVSVETVEQGQHYLQMKGSATSEFIRESISSTVRDFMNTHHLEVEDIEQVIPHQASRSIVMNTLQSIGIQEDRVTFSLEQLGNTSAGSIFITFDQYLRGDRCRGKYIILVGMGGGLNWGGVLLRVKN